MSRLGVKHNLILCLQSLKPLKNIHSCAIRLANKKFTVDMNLLHRYRRSKDQRVYCSSMGARQHGSTIVFVSENNVKDIWNYLVKHKIFRRGIKWYSYEMMIGNHGPKLEIKIGGQLIEVLTPKLIQIYEYTYSNYYHVTTISITEDLVTYKSIYHNNRWPTNLYFSKVFYEEQVRNDCLNVESTQENMLKILIEN